MVHFMFVTPTHSYVTNVFVCNLHISRVYSYVTPMLLLCTRVYSYGYSYVLVWYFSHDPEVQRILGDGQDIMLCYGGN